LLKGEKKLRTRSRSVELYKKRLKEGQGRNTGRGKVGHAILLEKKKRKEVGGNLHFLYT